MFLPGGIPNSLLLHITHSSDCQEAAPEHILLHHLSRFLSQLSITVEFHFNNQQLQPKKGNLQLSTIAEKSYLSNQQIKT